MFIIFSSQKYHFRKISPRNLIFKSYSINLHFWGIAGEDGSTYTKPNRFEPEQNRFEPEQNRFEPEQNQFEPKVPEERILPPER